MTNEKTAVAGGHLKNEFANNENLTTPNYNAKPLESQDFNKKKGVALSPVSDNSRAINRPTPKPKSYSDSYQKATKPRPEAFGILNELQALNDSDFGGLLSSFITEEIAKAAQLGRASDLLGSEIVGKPRKAGTDYAGIVFPYFLPPDFKHPRQFRLRRDKPDYEEKPSGEVKQYCKYLSTIGAQNCLYFDPYTTLEMLGDISLPLVIVEGEKKLLALCRLAVETSLTDGKRRFLAVAISGVSNFRTGNAGKVELPNGEKVKVKGVIPDFQRIALKGRKINILFDANVRTNQNVKAARFQLAEVFKQKGAKVFYADLPEECEAKGLNGVDDYLGYIEANHGTDAALKAGLEIIEGAEIPPKQTANPAAQNFILLEDFNELNKPAGVYFVDDTGELSLVCSPLKILAETQTETGENYGRLLEWTDSKERVHRWAVPVDLLHGDGCDFIKKLVSEGLDLMPSKKHREKLTYYIATSKPEKTIICTDKTGWHGETYVLPNETFGGKSNVVLQTETCFHKFNQKGSLEEWQENISKYCIGNSRLAFGVSAAFASVLLPIVNVAGGGFHYRGSSSTGKTTAAHVAGSTFGGSDEMSGYCQTWKATANGLESVAASHNHALLVLDEIGECEARQIGDIAYMLANGHGKQRMSKAVTARKPLTWQLIYISTGEVRLADKMREAGQIVKGGQEVRFCDIEADTDKYGIFENLRGLADGQALSDHLRVATQEYYGTAARAFLRHFVTLDREEIRSNWRAFQNNFTAKVLPDAAKQSSELSRVATRFALVAFAGEMATKFNITLWHRGEATKAAHTVFDVWKSGRTGRGGTDAENAVRQVRLFLEQHGQSRFQPLGADAFGNERIQNRVGFKRKNAQHETEFLFLPESFRKELCIAAGLDSQFVAKTLAARGYLIPGSGGKMTRTERCDEGAVKRVYVISSNIFNDDSDAESLEG